MSQTAARTPFLATITLGLPRYVDAGIVEASVEGRPLPHEATQYGRTQLPPQHVHDCDCCTFLGRRGLVDLYSCGPRNRETLVARRSSQDSDYAAVPVDTFRAAGYRGQPDIVEAYERYMVLP